MADLQINNRHEKYRDFDFSDCLFPEYFEKEVHCEKSKKSPRTYRDPFLLSKLEGMKLTPIYCMPVIEPYNGSLPSELITFSKARAEFNDGIRSSACPCFYMDDESFLCAVKKPDNYLNMLLQHPQVIGLDMSIQMDMPYATKVHNLFVNKLWTRYMQMKGCRMIANIVWAEPRLYDIAFDGFPSDSIVAVNSMGIKENRTSQYFWLKGYEEMLKRLNPCHIVRYGEPIYGEDESISTYYANNHLNRMRYGR